MCMNLTDHPPIEIDAKELEVVADFTYLGSNISIENSVQRDISARINKARNSYCGIRNILKSNIYIIRARLRRNISIILWMPQLKSQQELYAQAECI